MTAISSSPEQPELVYLCMIVMPARDVRPGDREDGWDVGDRPRAGVGVARAAQAAAGQGLEAGHPAFAAALVPWHSRAPDHM